MKYAWVENGAIRDLVKVDPTTIFVTEVAALYDQQVPNSARRGYLWDGTTLTPIADPAPPSAAAETFPLQLSWTEFQFLFTNAERIAIAASADVNIVSMRGVLADSRTTRIDLTANYIVDYFDSLQTANLITGPRKNRMLLGKFPKTS